MKQRSWWHAWIIIWLVKLVWLGLSTPLYDLDTNSFIRGGFSWDIYHNPFLNLYLASLGKIWANAWFLVAAQCLAYALAAATLLETWFSFRSRKVWYLIAGGVLALEPLTTFYNFSILAESFFTSFTLLTIALGILWLRNPRPKTALLYGLAIGLTFMCKLSAMIHLPLFGIFLLYLPGSKGEVPWWRRFLKGPVYHGGLALLPFVLCYAFVYLGQKTINEGDLYTVEGRVRWDFSSACYRAEEIDAPLFKQYVHPYILPDGALVSHRELRRELSYLGYKDCVADYEAQGFTHNRGVNACDSLFGAVAAQIMERHFWEAEGQFIRDNFRFVHELSYIDYRFTPGLYYYHPETEWNYLDSLMETHYQLNLAENQDKIPGIWTSLSFGNVYMASVWWIWWIAIAVALALAYWKKRKDLLFIGLFLAIPLLFHFFYISYRPRFLAPYLALMLLLVISITKSLWSKTISHGS